MKAKTFTRPLYFFSIFLFMYMLGNLVGCITSNTDDPSLIRRYDVYQSGATTDNPGEFNVAMANDPIFARMSYELHTQDILDTTYESQVFYSNYLKIWQDELSFSIDNLKKYLSDKETAELDAAQEAWEKSMYINWDFDRSVISNHEMHLGSQYTYSIICYLINQYSERVIHIKYMTYLVETNAGLIAIPESAQLWSKFHSF